MVLFYLKRRYRFDDITGAFHFLSLSNQKQGETYISLKVLIKWNNKRVCVSQYDIKSIIIRSGEYDVTGRTLFKGQKYVIVSRICRDYNQNRTLIWNQFSGHTNTSTSTNNFHIFASWNSWKSLNRLIITDQSEVRLEPKQNTGHAHFTGLTEPLSRFDRINFSRF